MTDAAASRKRCESLGCEGTALSGRHCLAHLTAHELEREARRLGAGGRLDARDTTISSASLGGLLNALRGRGDRAVLPAADFRSATFEGYADFRRARFSGPALFEGANFSDGAGFTGATFGGEARFDGAAFGGRAHFDRAAFAYRAYFLGATFEQRASFDGAVFEGRTRFGGSRFARDADFTRARFNAFTDVAKVDFGGLALFGQALFRGDARFQATTFGGNAVFATTGFDSEAGFDGATFQGDVTYDEARFASHTSFLGTTFRSSADFTDAVFGGTTHFRRATFDGDATFDASRFARAAGYDNCTFGSHARFGRTTFERGVTFSFATFDAARQLGPFTVGRRLVLDDCVFAERVIIEVDARTVSAHATAFAAGAHLRVSRAHIALDDADFARPSTLSAAPRHPDAARIEAQSVARTGGQTPPRLITLRGAHVAELSLSNIDLRACRFFGAHGLESLRIEATCQWARTPGGMRWSERETIAEEHHWRGGRWDNPDTQQADWLGGRDRVPALRPMQVATMYRALRKAREDGKDHAGASDLYYGEMEMRRQAVAAPKESLRARLRVLCDANLRRARLRALGDRFVLTGYWLISGYGLKAGRALALFIALVAAASVGFYHWGFETDAPFTRAWLLSVESTSSLFRAASTHGLELTYLGERLQIALRLLGPLLLGLALLAVRARIKR